MVFISNRDNSIKEGIINEISFIDFLKNNEDRIAIAQTESIPAGIYAKQALKSLNSWEIVKDKLVQASNVKTVLNFVDTKAINYGIVYYSDAYANDKVKIMYEFRSELHEKIIYQSVVMGKHNTSAVIDLYNYILSNKSKEIFRKFGFITNIE